VGTHKAAVAALGAEFGFPHGDFFSDIAFFVLRGASGEGAVERQLGNRQLFAALRDDFAERFSDKRQVQWAVLAAACDGYLLLVRFLLDGLH